MLPKNTTSKLILGFFLFITLLGCDQSNLSEKTNSFDDCLELSIQGQAFSAQIAITEEELARGLMFRQKLEKNQGMLFVFSNPKKASFWMKNTSIPLDVGYFDSAGRLVEIYQLYPFDQRAVHSKSQVIKYALEMSIGWFQDNNISTGHTLDLIKVNAAIQKRK